ncbi:flagella synthesis protein FlgN [Salinicola aestuarinus]|uniref:flagella synthesis protein FlgN n=1 Tax=Salinicola aestuarinus TaxID=1949082 RepID=UPI000DA20CEF|nr:flagellar export chaperone FlgN [Salinicola aestuarinus]
MSLTSLLAEQQRHLEALNELLEDEREHLNAGEIDGERLGQIASEKQMALNTLDAIEASRRTHQAEAGLGTDSRGAEELAIAADAVDQWQRIRELAESIRRANLLNGHIISQRLEQNQQAIDFLQRAVGGSTYGPKGKSLHKGFGGISSSA